MWRFIARRTTTETVTIERDDTEDLPAADWPTVMHQWRVEREPPPPTWADELDPACPVPLTQPPVIFTHLLKHPPVTAKWRPRLGFTADLAARATADTALVPLPPVPYPPLDEDTLAGEYAAAHHMDPS